jgi:meromycolic acid (3R)-3-hydroxyacyl-[acyl-carrier protein] dehydratase HadB
VIRAFATAAVGASIPELRRVVLRDDVRAYAEVSGDRNPLHQDDAFARSVGFGGIIAHGMFTMGHMAACVGDWAGDPAAVSALSAQFRATVAMGEELVAGGTVRELDAEMRTVTLDLWVRVDRDDDVVWPIKRGEATVRLS